MSLHGQGTTSFSKIGLEPRTTCKSSMEGVYNFNIIVVIYTINTNKRFNELIICRNRSSKNCHMCLETFWRFIFTTFLVRSIWLPLNYQRSLIYLRQGSWLMWRHMRFWQCSFISSHEILILFLYINMVQNCCFYWGDILFMAMKL
jgi:hypothetical protein